MNLVQTIRPSPVSGAVVLAFAFSLTGCADKKAAQLESTFGERDASQTVVKNLKGVHMEATPKWPQANLISNEATPLLVTIENNSEEALILRYEYFSLNGKGGEQYAALPLFNFQKSEVAGAAPQPTRQYAPIADRRFAASGFTVASYYSTLYPGLTDSADQFYFDAEYYKTYGDELAKAAIPDAVYRWTIPEGILESGGRVEGVILFEPVNPDLESIVYRASLVNSSGRMFGYIAIPFLVSNTK